MSLFGFSWGQAPPNQGAKPTTEVQKLLTEAMKLPEKDQIAPLQKALDLAKNAGDVGGEVAALLQIGNVFLDTGRPALAIRNYQEAVPLARELRDRTSEAWLLNGSGLAYSDLDKKEEALGFLNQALQIWSEVQNRRGEASALNGIASIYDDLGQEQKALDFYFRALAIRRELKARLAEADVLSNIGVAYNNLGQIDQALSYFDQAGSIYRELKDPSGEGTVLIGIGAAYANMGSNEQAMEFYLRSLPPLRESGQKDHEAIALTNIGRAYTSLGLGDKALSYYNLALPIYHDLGDRWNEATTIRNIGRTYSDLGKESQALDCYDRALKLERESKDRLGEAATLNCMGVSFDHLGQLGKALEFYNEALPIERSANTIVNQAETLVNIGIIYGRKGQKYEALNYYNQALTLFRTAKDQADEAHALGCIANIYDSLGKPDQALEFHNQALNLDRKVNEPASEAITLTNIGNAYNAKGLLDRALGSYIQALTIEHEVGHWPVESSTLAGIGTVLNEKHFPSAAALIYKLSVRIKQSRQADARRLPPDSRESLRQRSLGIARDLCITLADAGRAAEAAQVVTWLKQNEFFVAGAGVAPASCTATPHETAWMAKYEALGLKYEKLGKEQADLLSLARLKRITASQTNRLTAVNHSLASGGDEYSAFFKGLQTAFSKPEKPILRSTQESAALQKVIDASQDRPAAIELLVADDGVRSLITLPRGKYPIFGPRQRVKAADLNKKVGLLRRSLSSADYDPRPLAGELYDLLIRPLERDLKASRAKSIMFSLDGTLRYLPVGALYDRVTGRYLCQKYPVSLFIPARLSDLARARSGALLAVGFGVSKPHTIDGDSFSGLDGVPVELSGLKTWTDADVYQDAAFTADALKAALSRKPTLVHLATHFRLRAGDPAGSFLLLGDGKTLPVASLSEWMKGSFSGVDLLALSACDTNSIVGMNSDGVEIESFARAAQENGAAAVLGTLWPVNDASTALFMSHFYQLRKAHPKMTKTEAIRQSQMWLMNCKQADLAGFRRSGLATKALASGGLRPYKQNPGHPFAHPFYWAPFVLTGNIK